MHTTPISRLALCAALLAFAAPGHAQTATQYPQTEVRMLHQVQLGVISAVREVVIDATSTGQGAAAGAVVGSVAGLQSGNAGKAALGGLAGALLGQGIEQTVTRRNGVELLIKVDDGSLVSVTQQADGLVYAPGQRVRLLLLNGAARVIHHGDLARPATAASGATG